MQSSPHATETSLVKLLKATAIGGLLFLLPLIVVAMLLGHAVHLAATITQPISSLLTLDRVVGPEGERLLAIVALVATTIAASFLARTKLGKYVGRGFRAFVSGESPHVSNGQEHGGGGLSGRRGGKRQSSARQPRGWMANRILARDPPQRVGRGTRSSSTHSHVGQSHVFCLRHACARCKMTAPEAMMLIKHMGIGSATVLVNTDLDQPRRPTAL